MAGNITDDGYHIYTEKEFDEFAHRLHYNTVIDIIVNSIAIYVVLKHSTPAMRVYKYFIFSTLISAFIMDFHITFIFGPFLILPSPILCGAGFIGRHFGYFGAHTIPYSLVQVMISCVGFSILYSLIYQYYSLDSKADFMLSIKSKIIMLFLMIIYPSPSILSNIINLNYEKFLALAKEKYSYSYDLLSSKGCYQIPYQHQQVTHNITEVCQILIIAVLCYAVALKVHLKITSLKNVLSAATIKARKQFLIALVLQFTVPSLGLIVPLMAIFGSILLDIKNSYIVSVLGIHIMACHSLLNALTVMIVITPYRQTLLRWLRIILKLKPKLNKIGLQSSATQSNHQ